MDHLLEHFVLKPIVPIEVAGLDLSINLAVISMWTSSLVMLLLVWFASRRAALVPSGRLANFIEVIVDFVNTNIVEENMGHHGRKWFPFLFSLFMFIWGANLIGLVPGFYTATSSIFVTATLAFIVVFQLFMYMGFVSMGFFRTWVALFRRECRFS